MDGTAPMYGGKGQKGKQVWKGLCNFPDAEIWTEEVKEVKLWDGEVYFEMLRGFSSQREQTRNAARERVWAVVTVENLISY